MTDAFAELNLPRRAALDPAELQARYHELSRDRHPDAAADAEKADRSTAFARLNQARDLLDRRSSRLRHLGSLLFPDFTPPHGGALNGELMDLFSRLAPALQHAAALAVKKRAAASPLAKALLLNQELPARESLEDLCAALDARLQAIDSALPALDAAPTAESLDHLSREASFVEKWLAQARETLLQLAMGE